MASTNFQPWNPGLARSSEEKEWRFLYKNNKLGCKQKSSTESLWIDGGYNPTCLRQGGPSGPQQAHAGEFCEQIEKVRNCTAGPRNDDGTAFVTALRACAKNKDLSRGTKIHDDILKKGLLENCSDALITMYARCGALLKGKELLDSHRSRDVYAWTALITAYARQGHEQEALNCFERMKDEGLYVDAVTFACILKVCGNLKAADKGEQFHDEIVQRGLLANNIILGNVLVDMYVKCGALSRAQSVVDELPSRDVVSWNALITGYAQQGQGTLAFNCFERMQHEGISPNAVTFTCVLKACGSLKAVDKGEHIHEEIARQGLLQYDIVLGNALVDMYVKCGALVKAAQVLEELPSRNVVSWTALIAGYAQQGQGEQALYSLKRMQCEGLSPDTVTFSCVLNACGTIGAADKGEQIHNQIVKQGLLEKDTVLGSALVDMYAKCGALTRAAQVLEEIPSPDVSSWNALMGGYVQRGQGEEALNCLDRIQQEGLFPNAVTFTYILKACGSIGAAEKGGHIHDEIAKLGLLGDNIVLGNALVDMYAKCGALGKAQQVLEELPSRNVVSWSALIAGYVQQGQGEQALNCFEQMWHEGLFPDAVTFACILKACGSIGAVDKGQGIHDEVARQGFLGESVVLGNALVDMYAKCGALANARQVLAELSCRNVVSWNSLIAGYSQQGQGEQALNTFKWMQREGVSPDAVTFSSVLSVCSHLGLVEDGHMYFVTMSTKYGIKPDVEHYNCMVDLFGRAGHLDNAVRIVQEMPSNYSAVWSTLLGACRKWGNLNVGRWAFEHAVQIDKSDVGAYVLMANIYAAAGMQESKPWKGTLAIK